MFSQIKFAKSELMGELTGFLDMGDNPMVGATVAYALNTELYLKFNRFTETPF